MQTIIPRGREKFPGETPRIISDNGPQFSAKDFKEFIRLGGLTQVRTSAYYPQSHGKIERWHRPITGDCIRTPTPLTLEDAQRIVAGYVAHYNGASYCLTSRCVEKIEGFLIGIWYCGGTVVIVRSFNHLPGGVAFQGLSIEDPWSIVQGMRSDDLSLFRRETQRAWTHAEDLSGLG